MTSCDMSSGIIRLNFNKKHFSMTNFKTTKLRCNVIESKFLGSSDLNVSNVSYGTMLFGKQIKENDAMNILNCCYENNINFFDTAEMYPVPACPQTYGSTEKILGKWLRHKPRDKIIISCKVCGPSGQMTWIRQGPLSLDKHNIKISINDSLMRLNTDYIDLMQLHWPDRYVPMFGETLYNPKLSYNSVSIEEQLECLSGFVREGKIRYIGLSNETPWGLMQFIHHHKKDPKKFKKIISIQNAYNLLCRNFSEGLAECCHMENIKLLAYSPLAMGLLTGKYLKEKKTLKNARLNLYKGSYVEADARYGSKPNKKEAILAYSKLASTLNMTLTELSLRFVLSNDILGSMIMGTSDEAQLKENLNYCQKSILTEEILKQVNGIHLAYPNPTP